jgi:hypothetical protein
VLEKLGHVLTVQPALKVPIDYRDLSERHLCTIYEGLLEYTLQMAQEPMAELQTISQVVPLSQVNGRLRASTSPARSISSPIAASAS